MSVSPISFGDVLPGGIDAIARGGIAASQARLPGPLREVHRQLLREFLRSGRPPSVDYLRDLARTAGLDPQSAIADLAQADLVHLSSEGAEIAVAYPFSARASAHLVALDSGPVFSAMCAVDALGIPVMAQVNAIITARDPVTREPIRVQWFNGHWTWTPDSAVVVLAAVQCSGPIAFACKHTGFHATKDLAERHLAEHAEQAGRVLSQAEAVQIATTEFGPLLAQNNGPHGV